MTEEDSGEEYGEEYEVEAVRAWRYVKKEDAFECLIKWENYSESDNSWESCQYLNCDKLVKEYKRTLTKEDRRNFNLRDKSILNGFERHAIFKGIVGTDKPPDTQAERDEAGRIIPFYILVQFDDADEPEEFTLFELFKYQPEETFAFCEKRLFKRQKMDPKAVAN